MFEKDTDAYARDRDRGVRKLAEDAGVEVIVKMGRTLYDPDELVKHNGGRPTMSMAQTQKAAAALRDPARPILPPTSLPDPGDTDLSSIDHQRPDPTPDLNAAHRDLSNQESQYTSIMGPNKDFAIPTLEEMGISGATSPHRGGETIALRTLDTIISNSDYTGLFEKPKTAPTAFSPQSTTLLSPHHHFGSLSIRLFYWRVQEIYQKRKLAKKPNSSIPENLHGQLLFRDMYFGAQAALGAPFAQEVGNPICKFVDWHLRSKLNEHNLLAGDYIVDDEQAESYFRRWKFGVTGFPWIDALMRQLRREGWIHHLGRHAVACFLTRGGCYVHWERGAEVFEEWLIDHEVACNSGNWMWLSCTAFFSQFFRVYSPVAFPKKSDPAGEFVRHFVPELKNFHPKYIYEPWKAPVADQRKWGCLVRGEASATQTHDSEEGLQLYPKPMFDFDERRRFCLDKMKRAYQVGMQGDDARVLDGSWKALFGYAIEGEGEVRDETNALGLEDGDESGERKKKRVKVAADPGREGDDDRVTTGNHAAAAENDKMKAHPKPPAKGGKGAKREQATLEMMVGTGRKKTKR